MKKGIFMGGVFLSPTPYRVLRIFLGVMFLVSGLAKSMDLVFFSKTIQAFAIIPGSLSFPAAVMIVAAEIVLGGGLVLDIRFCLGGILVLVLGFMAAIGHAIHMGYDIDCGCFGPGDPEAAAFQGLYTALYRDLALLAVSGYLFLWRHKTGHRPVPLWFNKQN
ncbi:MAG: DoxX family protein [Proteobacteria bacterium]|nr:DoxX family protein [Pseudomonadota bacterium]